jgi:hypothetical protein
MTQECFVPNNGNVNPSTTGVGGPNISPVGQITPNDGVQRTFEYIRSLREDDDDPLQAKPQNLNLPFRMPTQLDQILQELNMSITNAIACLDQALAEDKDFDPNAQPGTCILLDNSYPLSSTNPARRQELAYLKSFLVQNNYNTSTQTFPDVPVMQDNDFMKGGKYPDLTSMQNIAQDWLNKMTYLYNAENIFHSSAMERLGNLAGPESSYIMEYLLHKVATYDPSRMDPHSGFGGYDIVNIVYMLTGAHLNSIQNIIPMISGGNILGQNTGLFDACGVGQGMLGSLLGALDKLLMELMDALANLFRPLFEILAMILRPLLAIINEILNFLRLLGDLISQALASLLNYLNPCFWLNKFQEMVGTPDLNDILSSDRLPDRPFKNSSESPGIIWNGPPNFNI